MDFVSHFRGLRQEALSALQYRCLTKGKRVLAFIGLFPFIVMATVLFAHSYVLLFIYEALSSVVEYMELWLKGMKKDVRHASEFVLYLICTPVLFALRLTVAFFPFFFSFLWFFTNCVTFVASLGSVRYQPFMNKADFSRVYRMESKSNLKWINLLVTVIFAALVAFIALKLLPTVIEISNPDVTNILSKLSLASLAVYGASVLLSVIFERKTVEKAEGDEDDEDAPIQYGFTATPEENELPPL